MIEEASDASCDRSLVATAGDSHPATASGQSDRKKARRRPPVMVEVKVVQAEDGQWYLDKFEKIGLLPSPDGQ